MPDSIGRYEIKAELGRGGFGRVYRAWDPTVGRMVAIKTLNAGGDPELLQRFRNEAAAAGKLRHRNIVVIHDFGEAEGEPYIVMELLEGEDLHRVMQAQRSLTLLQKMQIMVQVAEGLDHAHRNGVVHRDVKPANMMLLPDNTVKLMDFGIALVTQVAGARLTKTGTVPGTLKYMAPEQFRGASNDLLSDIFAYGVTYYELVSGRHPFDGPAQPAIMFNILSADPAPLHEVCPECPEALSQVIHRCLQKERENRYPSLDDLLFDTLPVLVELRGLHAKGMLAEAQRLATAGQQETANALLREVLELDPANRTARDLRELLQTEIRRRVIRPKVEEMLHSGRQRLVAREFAEAIQAAESALRLDRSSEDALALMAQARSGKQQAEDAGKLVQQARSALSSDNLTGAYQLVNEALQFDPHHPEGGQLIERVRESIALREHDRRCSEGISRARGSLLIEAFDDALTQLERLQREYPDNAEIPRLLGEARAAQQQHQRKVRIASEVTACKEKLKARAFDDAVSRLETLDREFPETTEIRDLLSYAREERKAKKRQETIERLMREVAQLEQQSNYDAAIQMLERGLGYYPGDLTIDRRLQAMRLARTAWIRQQALDLALEQGESLRAEGRYTEALRAVDVFRASHGNDEPRVETLRVSIEAEWQENKRANAVRTFTEEVERLLSGGEVGTAVRVAEKALALYPEDALRAILTKAQDALRAHQRAEAVGRLMSQAQDLTRTQKYDHALKVIEQGLKEFPDDSGLQRAQTAALGAKDSFERAQAARKAIAQAKAMLAVQKNADAVSACQAVLNRYAGTDFEERRELLALIEQAEAAVREKEARESAISKLLEQARGLCAERKFDAAIAALDQGLRNYANDVRVAQARQDAYVARDVHDRRVSLMAIREALSTGRLADAERLLSTAVSRFAGDPEFKGLQEDLRQRMRRAAVDALVSDAEGKAAAGEFDSALRLLEQGRSVYQSEPALDELFRKVQERKKQYDREIGLQNALENIQESLLFERLDDAAEAIAATRKSYGPDPRIDAAGKDLADRQELRRKADAEQQRQEGINRAVREAGALASAGKHEQATRFLDDAIKQYPGEQALLRAKENVEQARRRYVAQKIAEACRAAEQQLTRGQFDEASATLSQAESTYGTDPGIAAVRSSLTEARARADAELGRQEEERRRIEEARRQREEEGRKKAEEERLRKAEADRQRQEQERLRAAEEEKERQEKERLRKIAEEKQRQEEDRLRQEELKRRQEAERARVEAERVKAEAERVRLEAERAKAEAERLRLEAERKQKEEEQQRRREAEAARAAAISSLVEQASKLQAQNQFDAAISHIDRALTAYRDEPALIRARDAAATAKSEYLRQQAVTAAVSEARAQMARGEIESAVAGAEAAIRQYPGEAALTRVLREAQQALEKKKAEEAARQKREGDVAELRSLLERASASSNKGDRKNFTKRASAIAAAWRGDSEIAALAAQVQNAPMPVSATPAPVAEPIRTPSPVSISDVAPPPKSSPMKWIAAAVLVVVAGGVGYVATRPSPEVKETPPKKEEPPPKVEAKKEVKKKEEPPIETPPPPPVEVAQGTLIVATGIGGVDIYVDAKRVGVTNSSGALQLPLEAKDYRIRAEKSGYQTVAPQQVTIAKNARKQVSFKLNPAEATLVLQGATAGATVKLDARSVGTVGADGSFSVTVPAGDHVVEFTKDQFQSRLLRRMFEPGQRVVLERNEVALTAIPKVDPQAAVSQEWERMKNSRDLGQLEDFARRNSSNPLAKLALDRVQDLRWQGVDKNNPAALRDYAAKNPNSPFAKTALDTALRLEWDAVDKSDQRALQAFRQKNANTEYAARATKELDRLEQSLAAGKKQADAKATAERINAERSEILQTLRKFTSGVEAKNLSAMVAAYPGIDRRLWQRSLSEVQSMKWTLTPLNEPEVQDTSATVTCNRSTTTVARNGQTQSLPATRVTVKLVKSSSGWVIEDIK